MCDTPEAIKRSLQFSVMEITSSEPRKAMAMLREEGRVQSIQLFGDRLHVMADSSRDVAEILNRLQARGIQASGQTISPSLEDVFISHISQ